MISQQRIHAQLTIDCYERLLNPCELVKHIQCFSQWCMLGTVDDLKYTLLEFERHYLYVHCMIIIAVLFKKIEDESV